MEISKKNALLALASTPQFQALSRANSLSQGYGLSLSTGQMLRLLQAQGETLLSQGRVEFGQGALPALIYAFCDSPYLMADNYFETLLALDELFYYFKNESNDVFSDDEVIDAMKAVFDGEAQGAVEYLRGLTPEELYRLSKGLEKEE